MQILNVELGARSYPILIGPVVRAQLHPQGHELTRLGEFLLPGTTAARVLHAVVVEFNAARLRLIMGQGDQQRLA